MKTLSLMLVATIMVGLGTSCHRKQSPASPAKQEAVASSKAKSKQPVQSKSKPKTSAKAKPATQSPKPKKESALSSTLDDLTGKTTIERGLKAQDDIKRISAKHNKELNEILGE